MNLIDLSLKNIDDFQEKIYSLDEAIKENKIIVILGAPGSGKSSILKKFQQEHDKDTQLESVKRFIKFKIDVNSDTQVLILDGLDEYRSVTHDKTFVLHELGFHLKKILEENRSLRVVISCREMDWYGEHDKHALKNDIGEEATIFYILPLNDEQKEELANILRIDDREDFLEKFSDKGFLDNPQMFYMLSEIWQSDRNAIHSKNMLYEKFIEYSKEYNFEHEISVGRIEQDDIFKIAGYLAFYYMFAGVDIFDENIIDKIVDNKNGYTRKKIEAVLKTKIFSKRAFIHRTIAEYILAKYIIEQKIVGSLKIEKERIKSLFVRNGKIPTELRGTYAWLCSLGVGEDFIAVDPYYQAIHGDNSLFNYEKKKKIIQAVKEYSKDNPYFFEYNQSAELEGFYTKELDDFLINEYQDALDMKNHYGYFIVNIIAQGKDVSEKIKKFAKRCIENREITAYFKRDFISLFYDECEYLKSILNKIKEKIIEDPQDLLKEAILRKIYLRCVSSEEVVDYLMSYQSIVIGHCLYLYNTPYEQKFRLIDKIYRLSYTEDGALHLPENVKDFISDYFIETVLLYKEKLSAKKIFGIIKHFRKYYKWHEGIQFETYRYAFKEKLESADEKLQRLANELFKLYVNDQITNDVEGLDVYSFYEFFNLKHPTNQSEVLFDSINKDLNREINLNLFLTAINHLPRDKNNTPVLTERAKKIAAEHGFNEDLQKFFNPKKSEYKKRLEKTEKERLQKEAEIKEQNKKYFSSKSDEEIKSNFSDLYWIAAMFFLSDSNRAEESLEPETRLRLKNILKQAIFSDLISPEYLTIESLAESSPNARRKIDIVYYISLALNTGETIEKIENTALKEYLYINSLQHSRAINTIKSDFIEQCEEKDLSTTIELLQKYILILIEKKFPKFFSIAKKYITSCEDIYILKNIATIYGSSFPNIQNDIFKNFLRGFWFQISKEDLSALQSFNDLNDENRLTTDALLVLQQDAKDKFSINMAIAMHDLINNPFSERPYEKFQRLAPQEKVKVISYMMSAFNTEESIEPVNGVQSPKDLCADFLRNFALTLLDFDELKQLHEDHAQPDDIWKNRILSKINEVSQQVSDQLYSAYTIDEVKRFIFENKILSKEDFFTEVFLQLDALRQIIEDNRDNDKFIFYDDNGSKPKVENSCRDIVLQRLKSMNGDIFDFNKEHSEAQNRVDINIRYKKNLSFEVQVECKRDNNPGLYTGIQDQLIDKYFSSGVQYGIYLLFYFGDKKNKQKMIDEINNRIPKGYKDKIKVVCIDLTLG